MKPFRQYHIVKIFSEWEEETETPFDLHLHRYAKSHHQLGSKDRKVIRETCFQLLRWKRLLDQEKTPLSWEERLKVFLEKGIESLENNGTLSLATRCSLPEWIFAKLEKAYGKEKAFEIGQTLNERAPFTIRANKIKTTREALFEELPSEYNVRSSPIAPQGILFDEPVHLLDSPLYKEGLFEIQDEASQYVSHLIKASPGDLVLDYCAGSGGKSLAIAPDMEGKGMIYLHDNRPSMLVEAVTRCERAGIKNYALFSPLQEELLGKIDILLIDAPCSGSGTWRRSPDQKWKFQKEMLDDLILQQREIVKEALPYLKKGGRLIYVTCSLFEEENQDQIDYITKAFPLRLQTPPFQSIVQRNGMDGFFAATLQYYSCD